MWGEPKQANSATTALIYITLGSLIDVWSVVYWYYLRTHGGSDIAYLYLGGFFFSGLVLFLIGLAVGRIGSAARKAEVAPIPTAQIITPDTVAPVVSAAPGYQAPVVTAAPLM